MDYYVHHVASYNSHYVIVVNAVSGQECTGADTVGSLDHGNNIVTADQTFIFDGYIVPCNRTVFAWEFCYQIGNTNLMTVMFYPGIWRITRRRKNGSTDYELIQSNSVAYDPRGSSDNLYPCKIFNLSTTDQFTAPAGSVVGLYSNAGPQLLHTNTDNSITTYQFKRNQSDVRITGGTTNVNYNIAIRVHLGKT